MAKDAENGSLQDSTSMKTEIDRLVNSQIQSDENFSNGVQYLQQLLPEVSEDSEKSEFGLRPFSEERKLREKLRERQLALFDNYAEQYKEMNDQVQGFVAKLESMNEICNSLSNRIQSNKERTRDLLRKTLILQTEKKQLLAKESYLNEFFEKYDLPEEDLKALSASSDGTVSESFFKAFKKLLDVIENVSQALQVTPDNAALSEISKDLISKRETSYNVLFSSIERECRLLNVEFLELKPILHHSFEALQSRENLFQTALTEYCNARRGYVVHAFIDALTKGGKSGSQRPIEQSSTESLRYVNDMLGWIHQALEVEKELLINLLKSCKTERVTALTKNCLATIGEGLCQPLKLRVEQSLMREGNCVVLYRLSSLFLFYVKNLETILGDCILLKTLQDLHELASNMFFSTVSSTVNRILGNMTVPDYDLLPVSAINQTLLLLRDILESQNDGAFAAVIDKKDIYKKIFSHILDPLNQSIQLVSSNLHSHLDIAVYMLNCLNAIKSVIILYQYTDSKLEMIKAQIDANEDVLVSEQASMILTNTGLIEIYRKSLAHQQNQGPLGKIQGMEVEKILTGIGMFNAFLEKPEGFQCHQCGKINSARIRESIQKRTVENVVAAYSVIFGKISDPENGYPKDIGLKKIEEVKEALEKISN
ncbi:hypothetical protein FO519_001252 [Halicephalobus sp. NKZ332]|nr:hypothetical protein FO519_001252 [Halicephalobus sp. NKZ332]